MTAEELSPLRRRMRRLKTLPVLPTLLTAGNLACGITAILCAASATRADGDGFLWAGALFIFGAMVCDMLDGKVARLTRTEGAFGAELDSLADVVSFGVAPAMLVHRLVLEKAWVLESGGRLMWFVAVFYAVMAAIRLARYNVEHTNAATASFRGIPSPGAAAVVCAWVIVHEVFRAQLQGLGFESRWGTITIFGWTLMGVTTAVALLMVSNVPFPHVGNTMLGRMGFRRLILLLCMAVFFVVNYALALLVLTTGYVCWGLIAEGVRMSRNWRAGRGVLADPEEDEAEDAGLEEERTSDPGPAPGR